MMKRLYISPHLDDVVLSCGGTICNQVRQGDTITVATVFTNPGNIRQLAEHYAQRKIGDFNAANELGFNCCHLEETDAPFRNSSYKDFYTIMFPNRQTTDYQNDLINIKKTINKVIDEIQADVIYAPLGAGTHVDHQLVFDAVSCINDCFVNYYEERPYAFLPGAVAGRWITICDYKKLPKGTSESNINWKELNLPFMKNYMTEQKDIKLSLNALNHQYNLIPESLMEADDWQWKDKSWKRNKTVLSVNEKTALLSGISCYQTELKDLFDCNCSQLSPQEIKQKIESIYSEKINANNWYEATWTMT